jgi:hypothetical protein
MPLESLGLLSQIPDPRHAQGKKWQLGHPPHPPQCSFRFRLARRAKDRIWQRREEVSFYVRFTAISAESIRGDWGVENRNHYVHDIAMLEDASHIRANPGIFAGARSFALNILRANGENNIADALWCNALHINRRLEYRCK